MQTLQTTLIKLQDTLNELDAVLTEEIKQLSHAQVNAVALQQLSDIKSSLLATLAWHDEQRKQTEKDLQLQAPYEQQPTLTGHWNRILQSTQKARDMNLQASYLLDIHMKKLQSVSKILNKSAASPGLYTAGGQSENNGKARAYNITI
ncbi:flagellar export chaperone FlgN [Pantoea alhagi]|uniref:flagella synthesis protein FlgN n=1 Tax=Pantoea alhagi TaxID=1891675 RepID=UPI00202B132F|nr:flagellar export chaperone FlgN [Pantoea alhagi]URQ60848.1 flagellar export chaperone FlgN [Pantoea alhagi]